MRSAVSDSSPNRPVYSVEQLQGLLGATQEQRRVSPGEVAVGEEPGVVPPPGRGNQLFGHRQDFFEAPPEIEHARLCLEAVVETLRAPYFRPRSIRSDAMVAAVPHSAAPTE